MNKKKKKFNPEVRCLNCDTPLTGTFCSQCGQKSGLDQDHFWHMVWHFVADYFHFDGKFFTTTKAMFFTPGLVTLDYLNGKRKKYLHPIQMYIFVSALFFLVLNSIASQVNQHIKYRTFEKKQVLHSKMMKQRDSVFQSRTYNTAFGLTKYEFGYLVKNKVFTKAQYDSCEASIPAHLRDNWLQRKFNGALLRMNERNLNNASEEDEHLVQVFFKTFPKAFFILLPLFAFLLYLFFNRKPYTNHVIFSLHFHTVSFILVGLIMFCSNYLPESLTGKLTLLGASLILLYLLFSIKRVYQESWGAVLLKMIFLTLFYSIVLFFTMCILFMISFFLV